MPERPEYDYIVVGSGAGGGPLAANLAKAGYQVALLEAGTDDSKELSTQVPAFHAIASEDEQLNWDFFVEHYADERRQRSDSKYDEKGRGILYPRCSSLGGCTVHHALITLSPHNSDWDRIATITGDPAWRSHNMRKYFERLERCRYGPGSPARRLGRTLTLGLFGNPSRHGYHGWLPTETANPLLVLRACRNAFLCPDWKLLRVIYEAAEQVFEESPGSLVQRVLRSTKKFLRLGFDQLDPNDWRRIQECAEGLAFTPLGRKRGRRAGPREYLKEIQQKFPENLIIQTGALATRVLFQDKRAVGVEYLEGLCLYRAGPKGKSGQPSNALRRAFVRKEVILAAGTFNTPQLLKLSGVGPAEELRAHGIEVVVDLPGVGENLQDRYEVSVVSQMEGDFGLLEDATFSLPGSGQPPDRHLRQWRKRGKGVYSTNGVVAGIIKKSKTHLVDPDLLIFAIPGFFRGYYRGYAEDTTKRRDYLSWVILKGHTRNRAGRVTLRSKDPRDVPKINFRYFDDDPTVPSEDWQDDLDSLVEGVKFVRRMNCDPGLQPIIQKEIVPGNSIQTTEEIRDFIKREAWGHHASGTCKIGPREDRMAVLSGDFRVHGTRNLRVVDASVFPYIPGLFIVSAVYMISEKASDVILSAAQAEQP